MTEQQNWKIYTKQGDSGETSLIGGGRVLKSHVQIEAYGTVDELNSFVGLLRDKIQQNNHKQTLLKIQKALFVVESFLAVEKGKEVPSNIQIDENDIALLETEIDKMENDLPILENFILPGGHELNSLSHICRTVCRRAERTIIEVCKEYPMPEFIVKYINRLSDYFFVLARTMTFLNNAQETIWDSKEK